MGKVTGVGLTAPPMTATVGRGMVAVGAAGRGGIGLACRFVTIAVMVKSGVAVGISTGRAGNRALHARETSMSSDPAARDIFNFMIVLHN
ncbi:MAG: hypothetical protein D6803_08260 [Anaerolineae bacterium]|nr:MAG: hypothetical protein D6803_08260 [Anaerolineae bacterium]